MNTEYKLSNLREDYREIWDADVVEIVFENDGAEKIKASASVRYDHADAEITVFIPGQKDYHFSLPINDEEINLERLMVLAFIKALEARKI